MTVGAAARQGLPAPAAVPFGAVVPAPVRAVPADGVTFELRPDSVLYAAGAATAVGEWLAALLRRSTGFAVPVVVAEPAAAPAGGIALLLSGAPPEVGPEGYRLEVTAASVVLQAAAPAGLFAGVQTLRQLLPPAVEAGTPQPGPWPVAGGEIVDHPRYGYRGAMLDVARHFFDVSTVERYLDQIALYKLNHLHLHLSDDQGWRIAIDSWPELAAQGGRTAVGGDPGGCYSKDDYRRIVAYAAARFVTVVPEIDMPGHTNAALSAYPELTCDGLGRPPYTGTDVGFSSLCAKKEITYRFVEEVLGEVAALTPGPYLHIGGDEARSTPPADYAAFLARAQRIVARHGKTVMAWHEVVNAELLPSTVAQYWAVGTASAAVAAAARRGTRLVMSPASRAYLDMKYTPDTPLGLDWAGHVDVADAYGWDPGGFLADVPPTAVLGVEAPLWTETVRTRADLEYLAFPRLPALAELAWSPPTRQDWPGFRDRLAAQGPRWRTMGVNYHRSPQIAWPEGS